MLDLKEIWNRDTNWEKDKEVPLSIPEYQGGVNPGDQRALYHIFDYLDVKNVLEIGTHIGCSTVSIALALKQKNCVRQDKARMTTVDIVDVNTFDGCPKDLLKRAGCLDIVSFEVNDSVKHMSRKIDKWYDCIFLDGDHSYEKVYEELPIAYDKLEDDGYILFHDYFPDYKPLWESSKNVLEGPFRAVSQLIREGLAIEVQPFGELPNNWKTKFPNECNTSLAIGWKI